MATVYGNFTCYDTVIFSNNNEMITKDYFTFLEKNIKNNLIKDCCYDALAKYLVINITPIHITLK